MSFDDFVITSFVSGSGLLDAADRGLRDGAPEHRAEHQRDQHDHPAGDDRADLPRGPAVAGELTEAAGAQRGGRRCLWERADSFLGRRPGAARGGRRGGRGRRATPGSPPRGPWRGTGPRSRARAARRRVGSQRTERRVRPPGLQARVPSSWCGATAGPDAGRCSPRRSRPSRYLEALIADEADRLRLRSLRGWITLAAKPGHLARSGDGSGGLRRHCRPRDRRCSTGR